MSAGTPGANIDDERPAINVMVEMRVMMDQRRRGDQLMGLAGSVEEAHVTMLGSGESSVCGNLSPVNDMVFPSDVSACFPILMSSGFCWCSPVF